MRVFGFEKAELDEVFNALHDPANWKMPVDRIVAADRLAISCAALALHVGGKTKVVPLDDGTFRVENAGYYCNIGA